MVMTAAYQLDGVWGALPDDPEKWIGLNVDVVVIFLRSPTVTMMARAREITYKRGGDILSSRSIPPVTPQLRL